MQSTWTKVREKLRASNAAWQRSEELKRQAVLCQDESGALLTEVLTAFKEGAKAEGIDVLRVTPMVRHNEIAGIEVVYVHLGMEKREVFYDEREDSTAQKKLHDAAHDNSGRESQRARGD